MALNENIKQARKDKKMTQKQLAAKLGVSHTTISDWESGNHKPDADTVIELCKILDKDANYMFDYKELSTTLDVKEKLKNALKENDFFEGEDLTEENFDKLIKFIEKNKEFIIDKKDE